MSVAQRNFRGVITPDIGQKASAFRKAFWTDSISTPVEVVERITCLLLIRRIDRPQIAGQLNALFTAFQPRPSHGEL